MFDSTDNTPFQVFPDVFTKRELNGLNLHCTNQDCPWHGTYEALEVSCGYEEDLEEGRKGNEDHGWYICGYS